MSNRPKVPFTTDTGRLVQGDVHTAQEKKDNNGRPVLDENGAKIMEYFFAIAVPKTATDSQPVRMQAGNAVVDFPGWTQNAIGKLIFAEGFGARPLPTETALFAWKIDDGDSTLTRGTPPKRICDYEGFAGCWIYKFKTRFPVRCYRHDAASNTFHPLPAGSIKRGDYIQAAGSVTHNENQQKPGVYLNGEMVTFVAYGKEILGSGGMAPEAAGFRMGGPLPVGASATPLGVVPAGAGLPSALPGAPAGAPLPIPSTPAPAPVYVQPNPGIMPGVPAAVPVPTGQVLPTIPGVAGGYPVAPAPQIPLPPAAAVSTGPQLTAKANGATYAQMVGAGWNDATLRQHGYMV